MLTSTTAITNIKNNPAIIFVFKLFGGKDNGHLSYESGQVEKFAEKECFFLFVVQIIAKIIHLPIAVNLFLSPFNHHVAQLLG